MLPTRFHSSFYRIARRNIFINVYIVSLSFILLVGLIESLPFMFLSFFILPLSPNCPHQAIFEAAMKVLVCFIFYTQPYNLSRRNTVKHTFRLLRFDLLKIQFIKWKLKSQYSLRSAFTHMHEYALSGSIYNIHICECTYESRWPAALGFWTSEVSEAPLLTMPVKLTIWPYQLNYIFRYGSFGVISSYRIAFQKCQSYFVCQSFQHLVYLSSIFVFTAL